MPTKTDPEKPVPVRRRDIAALVKAALEEDIQALNDAPWTPANTAQIENAIEGLRAKEKQVGKHYMASDATITLTNGNSKSFLDVRGTDHAEGSVFLAGATFNQSATTLWLHDAEHPEKIEILGAHGVDTLTIESAPLADAIRRATNTILEGGLTPAEAHALDSARKLLVGTAIHHVDATNHVHLSEIEMQTIMKAFGVVETEGKRRL